MSAIVEFAKRVEELKEILSELKEMEKRQKTNRRSFHQKRRLISTTRASSYVMMYNAIEASMRGALSNLRTKIASEDVSFADVSEFWRLDLIKSRYLKRMQDGVDHGSMLLGLVSLTSSNLTWTDEEKSNSPFSGNFGQAAAMKLKKLLHLNWTAPSGTLGGSDLENIRKRRNALGHGLETFDEAGAQTTADQLLDVLARVDKFMTSYLAAIEDYSQSQGYLTPVALLPDDFVDHQETGDFSVEEQPQIFS